MTSRAGSLFWGVVLVLGLAWGPIALLWIASNPK